MWTRARTRWYPNALTILRPVIETPLYTSHNEIILIYYTRIHYSCVCVRACVCVGVYICVCVHAHTPPHSLGVAAMVPKPIGQNRPPVPCSRCIRVCVSMWVCVCARACIWIEGWTVLRDWSSKSLLIHWLAKKKKYRWRWSVGVHHHLLECV